MGSLFLWHENRATSRGDLPACLNIKLETAGLHGGLPGSPLSWAGPGDIKGDFNGDLIGVLGFSKGPKNKFFVYRIDFGGWEDHQCKISDILVGLRNLSMFVFL